MSSSYVPDQLQQLADALGVATRYQGANGQPVEVPAETVRAVLTALGVDAGDEATAARSLQAHLAATQQRLLPAYHVTRSGDPSTRAVPTAPLEAAHLVLEDGTERPLEVADGLELPDDLPWGYHRLHARSGTHHAETLVIAAPARCPTPERTQWGWMAQLYQLRSADSWGMGDAADLRTFAERSARDLGAGFVVCNPLHAVTLVPPVQPSPYYPSSRRFTNPLYLRVEELPEVAGLEPDARQRLVALHERAREANQQERIDHDTVLALKLAALQLLHQVPRDADREEAYAAFRRTQGQRLVDFATFSALAEVHGLPWQQWPTDLQDPTSEAVARERERLADRVELHTWLQWLADEQLTFAHEAARAAGMDVGVVHDLAVGVDAGGADTWALQHEFAHGLRVGAPPDDINQVGQDWGQPPLRPDRLVRTDFRVFRDLVRTVLAHAGGLRIDHALGLFRLYWIPEDASATAGTYVRYPGDALLAILALEATRADAVVVGEDLGTVEEGVHEALRGAGVLGSQVLYFEWVDGRRRPASAYERLSLASVTTHDLPTATGWWRDTIVDLWVGLNLLGQGRTEEAEREGTAAERAAMLELLRAEGLVGEEPDEAELVVAMHAFLARTPSLLVAASPADAVGDPRQPNLPGTVDEYPNWRLPLAEETAEGPRPVSLERLLDHPGVHRLAAALRRRP